MQTKLLTDIISDIVGKQGSEILDLLNGKKDVNEFLIAKKLKITINQVRNILYKLSNYSLVTFTRKKDKKKGWYTYFWTLDNEKALELLEKKLSTEIANLEHKLKSKKEKRFYACKTCKTEISEETALLHNFTCGECGEVYELLDDKKIITDLENNISKLENERKSVFEELQKIKDTKGQKRIRASKREERKKKIERARKRMEAKKERDKLKGKGRKVRKKGKSKKRREKPVKGKEKKIMRRKSGKKRKKK